MKKIYFEYWRFTFIFFLFFLSCAKEIRPTEIWGVWVQSDSKPTKTYNWSGAQIIFEGNGKFIAENLPPNLIWSGLKGGVYGNGVWTVEKLNFQRTAISLDFKKIVGLKNGLDNVPFYIGHQGNEMTLFFGGEDDLVFEFKKKSPPK